MNLISKNCVLCNDEMPWINYIKLGGYKFTYCGCIGDWLDNKEHIILLVEEKVLTNL
jgi:hypothetical protein